MCCVRTTLQPHLVDSTPITHHIRIIIVSRHAGKMLAEREAWRIMKEEVPQGRDITMATICPTQTLGPLLQVGATASSVAAQVVGSCVCEFLPPCSFRCPCPPLSHHHPAITSITTHACSQL